MIFYFLKKKSARTIAITHLKDPKILISYSVGKEISLSHNTAFEMTPWNKHHGWKDIQSSWKTFKWHSISLDRKKTKSSIPSMKLSICQVDNFLRLQPKVWKHCGISWLSTFLGAKEKWKLKMIFRIKKEQRG